MNRIGRLAAGVLLTFALLCGASRATAAPLNVQGIWWTDPAGSEAGSGISFAHQGDVILATWFVFDAGSEPRWLLAELHKTQEGAYAGSVSRVTGPPFDGYSWKSEQIVETEVGTLTATFAGDRHGSIAYTVDGITATKPIVPQEFPLRPSCEYGANPDLAGATNYTDLWWDPDVPGWGLSLSHQQNVILAVWFTYDQTRQPTWFVAALLKSSGGTYVGNLSKVAGPPFGGSFDAAKVIESFVGIAVIKFQNGNNAAFEYTFTSDELEISRTKTITRQLFAPPAGTVCRDALPPPVTLGLCQVFGPELDWEITEEYCAPLPVPFSSIGGGLPALRLTANDGPVTITGVSAEVFAYDGPPAAPPSTPYFVGLTEGMVIAAGQTVTIELRVDIKPGTTNSRFAFSANGIPVFEFFLIVRSS